MAIDLQFLIWLSYRVVGNQSESVDYMQFSAFVKTYYD